MFVSEGRITIKAIHGSLGRFCVGDLSVPEGQMKVKDSVLDQFEPGSYSGKFDIAQVSVQSYTHAGRVVTELRARLNAIYIDEAREGEPETPVPMERDPAQDESQAATPATPPDTPTPSSASEADRPAPTSLIETEYLNEVEREGLAVLGEEAYALVQRREPVKLDPTVGRVHLRAQAAALKHLGYRFDGQSQTWHVAAA